MKILIIEDDIMTLEVLKGFVEKIGHLCEGFNKPREAVIRIQNKACDIGIVFTDFDMNEDMNGGCVTKEIKKNRPDIFVIGMSGSEENESSFKKNGSDGFLKKPFSLKKFKAEIERLTSV